MSPINALPCVKCGSHYYRWRVVGDNAGCDQCPPSLSDRVATAIAVTVVASIVVIGFALYGQLAYDDWTCGFKFCVEVVGE